MSSIDISLLSNCFSTQDSKSIQDFIKNFNDDAPMSLQESSNDSFIYNNNATNIALSDFVTNYEPNDLNINLSYYVNGNLNVNPVNGFNPYENELDNKDIYDLSTIDQTSDINENYGSNDFGYSITSEQDLYPELESSQSDYLPFDEAESIPETYEELLKFSIPIFNEPQVQIQNTIQPKKTIKKEEKGKRGRGRPPTELKKLVKKVQDAKESKDKHKIRVEKNNQASKEYRDRKADKKKQLDSSLAIELENYRKLKKIHTKLSLRIGQLENMIKMHPF